MGNVAFDLAAIALAATIAAILSAIAPSTGDYGSG